MDKIALVISLLALAVGGVAYWRSGGKQDVTVARQTVEQEIQKLRDRQKELVESASVAIRTAYEGLQQRMRRSGERLSELRREASESLQMQIDRAIRQLETLEQQVASGLRSVRDSTVAAARETQEALARRVRRLQARVEVLEAKYHINRALAKAEASEFDEAEEHLREAVDLIQDARQTLNDDYAYDAELDEVTASLRQAIAAVKARAADVRAHIERVVARSDALVSTLESDEQAAAAVAKKD